MKVELIKMEDGNYKLVIPADVVDTMPKGEAFTIIISV
jgi:hypothetical protein